MKKLWIPLLFLLQIPVSRAQQVNPVPADFQLRLQPNPAAHYVQVTFILPSGTGALDLFNVLGQKVKSTVIINSGGGEISVPMDLNALPRGVYLVRVSHGTQAAIRRLTVQ